MTLSAEPLVDPDAYDELVYNLMHEVMDRVIELASKLDITESEEEDQETDLVSLANSQANFTPTESAEHALSGTLLNVLMGVAITRRASLYKLQP